MGTAFAIYPSNLFPKYSPSNDRRLCQPNNQYAIFSQGKDISQHPVHSLMLEPATQSSYLWITRECEACCLVLHLKMIWKCCPGTARQLVKKHSVTRSQLWAAYLMEQTKILIIGLLFCWYAALWDQKHSPSPATRSPHGACELDTPTIDKGMNWSVSLSVLLESHHSLLF